MNAQPNHGMQVTTFENPMGIDGFEFVEFASPEPEKLHEYFRLLGFTPVARHRTRKITNYRQGDCTFLINEDPDSFAADFARQHGPSACGFAIRVNKLAEWVRDKQRITSALKQAVGKDEPVPFLLALKQAEEK